MTKVFLAAGVAMMAIAAPAVAGPGGHGGGHGGGNGGGQMQAHGGGGHGGGNGGGHMQARGGGGHGFGNGGGQMQARGGGGHGGGHMQARGGGGHGGGEMRAMNGAGHGDMRMTMRAEPRGNPHMQAQDRGRPTFARNDNNRGRDVARARAMQVERNRAQFADRRDNAMRMNQNNMRMNPREVRGFENQQANGYGNGGCPPGLANKNAACMPPGQARKFGVAPVFTANNAAALNAARMEVIRDRYNARMIAPTAAAAILGMPLAQATGMVPLNPVPSAISYLYPESPNYYYRYNDGYLYGVDRQTNLVDSLIPLLAGGYLPGTTLPSSYMSSYVPTNYGWNAFYPNTGSQCTRYANGVVYYVDCGSGMIESTVPVYDNGYGVGQMLPSSYGYYNVPTQYRSMYYDTPDYGYWYAPGAIYQYDQQSNLITSVAALLGQGMSVGQPMPAGYGVYNVPMDYRSTYYDSPNAWYRYSNGNIYQIDPVTQLVTAVVASALS